MEREKLLDSKEYWIAGIQLDLYNVIIQYMQNNSITQTELAAKLNVGKSYISQVLNGDFNHSLSKLVELALVCDKIPFLNFIDKKVFISNDCEDKIYELIPINRPKNITFSVKQSDVNQPHDEFEAMKTKGFLLKNYQRNVQFINSKEENFVFSGNQ